MSCGPEAARFRLLDGYVGWAAASVIGLGGAAVDGGVLTLSRAGIDPGELLSWFPPPRLARGCGPCAWYMASSDGCLLVRSCGSDFCSSRGPLGAPGALAPPGSGSYAVAARDHLVAVSDPGAGRVWLLGRDAEQTRAILPVPGVAALAFGASADLLMAVVGEPRLRRYDLAGAALAPHPALLPPGEVRRIAVGGDCALWIAVANGSVWTLWRAAFGAHKFEPRSVDQLAAVFSPSGVVAADENGFCLSEPGAGGVPQTTCWGWDGCPSATTPSAAPPPRFATQGQLLTVAIPSGTPRCRWHRVRIDADVPPTTKCWVDVGTSEDANPPDQGVPDPAWPGFPTGPLHLEDWQVNASGAPLDFLILQPPGQNLFVRLRLTGNGTATPTVRRVRIDLPRSTSLERLPAVFRETPDAEDFTERFLSLFDATIEQIDRAIVRAPALLDASGVPDAVLPWLGTFLDLAFDPAWTPAQRRRLLQAAPALYKLRGTREGIIEAIRVITGVTPAIIELALGRRWGILSQDARLGGMRLFGRSKARFRVGSSKLGVAPLKSFGNPDQDPLSVEAFRFTVAMPPGALGEDAEARARLVQLVNGIKPAHTMAELRIGGGGFVVGVTSMVGVDTMLAGLPKTVLGSVKLSRNFILAPSRRGRRLGFTVGSAAIGVETRL